MIELKKKNSPYRGIKLIINTANCLLNQILPTWTNKGSHGMDNTTQKKYFKIFLAIPLTSAKLGA